MIAIKHRYTDTTLCEFDVETVKQAAERGKADLRDELLAALKKCRKELSAWMRDHGDDIAT